MEEQKKGNSYEVQLQKKGNGTDEVMQYSCMEEQKKETVMNRCRRREMEQMKLCSALVWRNRGRETVMKQKLKKRNGTNEVIQYSCMEEQKKTNSYEIEVEEGKQNRRSYVVLLYGGTQEEKQL